MKKILIIEDDNELRENLVETLQLSNYNVFEARNGKEGVEKALKARPDIIVCDVSMPDLDGYGVLHVLSHHPETSSIPFIFLTGHREFTDLRKGMDLGADDYLIKPVNEADLLNAIEVRLKKCLGSHAEILDEEEGMVEFMQKVNESENFNLISASREVCYYKKKHILHSVGQRPANVFFVISGKLKEYLINDDGKELITNIYSTGDFIGYIDILEDATYSETVQVLEDAKLMLIPKADFLQLVNTDKHVAKQFITLLSQNMRKKEEKLLNLAYNSLRKKVAAGIVEVMDKFKDQSDGKPMVEISREDLANIVGSAQESMIRTLKEFKSEKIIEVIEGRILIINENKLRHLVY